METHFWTGKRGGCDVIMEDETGTRDSAGDYFYLFASQLDWQVANWIIKKNPGNNAVDHFLSMKGVSFFSLI